MWLVKLFIWLAVGYGAIVLGAYLLQTWLIFPSGLAGAGPALPPEAERLAIESGGPRVVLTRLPPSRGGAAEAPVLLTFAGNAWNADAAALMLHRIFPEHEVAALHYRGYGPSEGRPSAEALLHDAQRAYDRLTEDREARIVAIGLSIGSAAAVDLAADRSVAGIVLVTPFGSLEDLAARQYPWLPVRLLLRHRMETAATLSDLDVPTAVIAAARDAIVPAESSDRVRDAASDLRFFATIENAGHNDLYDRQAFVAALRQAVAAVTD
ncbi:alpha/beta hydrolase [Lutibaculum baratangense]|uniref:Serine aminopeptidase S33 domain-containing protein n=1 Tax=Lutibaculum baratangense AMV1 TaxID=631454 RepID=V4RMC2_9HYPH|nr:alpha/beta hydrolase [Lutibaculum baratangense]ESR27176.1 hypothetical protein N177_0155 [Lutibaculum baratangense AMV1]